MTKRLPGLSQNFLRSPALVTRLLGRTKITRHDVVYDIGAGSGVVSEALAGVAQSVVAIELDPRMLEKLRQNMAKHTNVQVQQADILKMPLPPTPYKVFANIPFSLSSQIVQRFTTAEHSPTALYIIVQEQFARKLLPNNKGYTNQLAITSGIGWNARVVQRLSPNDFYPRPNVPTVLLELTRRSEPLVPAAHHGEFIDFVFDAFTDPRKLWRAPLHQAGLPALASPSSLTLPQWVALFAYMQQHPRARGLQVLEQAVTGAQPVAPTELSSPSMRFLAERLTQTALYTKDAIAAPRIGVAKRLVALSDGDRQALVLVNPVVQGRDIHGHDHNGKPVRLQLKGVQLHAALREIALLG